MDYRDLLEEHYQLQERAAKLKEVIRLQNLKEFSSSGKIGASTPAYMRASPDANRIIPCSHRLERMEREQQQFLADRCRDLTERSFLQEQQQEAIRKRICGTPRHQPTRVTQSPRAAVQDELDDLPLGLYDEVKAMQAHIFEEAEKAARNARAFGRGSVRLREVARASSRTPSRTPSPMDSCSPVDTCTPDELRALSALQTPVPPPAVTRPSRIPRPRNLYRTAKSMDKSCEVPVSSKNRTGFLARDSVAIKLPHMGTQGNSGQEPKLHLKPAGGETGPKKAQFSSGAVIGSIKPAERRDATRAAVSQGEGEVAESLNLVREQPLARPELALSQAFQLLKNEDWEKKIDGLMLVRSLAQNHADILLPKLRDVCFAVVEEVKNLRSMVSCAAMTTLAHMFAHLRRAMDPEAEAAARVLLHKAGDSSLFIREDVDLALGAMVQSCSPRRVINALLAGGLRHKNSAVRKTTALHLQKLALLLGASRLLTGKKDLTESFLTAISQLALDAAQEVRFYARSCITLLSSHKDIIKMVDKCVPPKERSSIKDIILKSR
ncbi:uncharacterized protein LOC143510037 isoform X2 [Brachyhypopomus gauderio]